MSDPITDKLHAAFGRFQARDLAGAAQACSEILGVAPGHPDALHLLGVVRLTAGDALEAETLLTRALEGKPRDAVLLDHLGLAQLNLGRNAEAEASLRGALAAGGAHPLVHMRLGLALGAQGKSSEAIAALRIAAEKLPRDADAQLNLGNALAEAGDADSALARYEKVLALQPRHPLAHFNIGTLYRRERRWEEAHAAFSLALEAAPREPDIHDQIGVVHENRGRPDDALAGYERALAIEPRHLSALNHIGNLLAAGGRREEALTYLQRALDVDPRHADTCVNLGNLYVDLGRDAEARKLYEQVLAADPAGFEAPLNLGRLCRKHGERGAALDYLRRALTAGAPRAPTLSELAGLHRDAGDLGQAIASYREALVADPESVPIRYNLGETLKIAGRLDEAEALYEEALVRQANHIPSLAALAHVRQHLCSWDGIERLWERLRSEAIGQPDSRVTPFSSLSMPTTPAEQLACARLWARAELRFDAPTQGAFGFDAGGRTRHARLRVGYLSAGFRRHALAHLVAELFELHDRARFEIFAYSCGPDDGSAIRARIARACERFVDVREESHVATAQRIHRDEIDILVDLDGWTLGARTRTLAMRPAPVQVSWLGYPGTMGVEGIDYLIADAFVIPAGMECHYSERVVRLPGCYQINDRRREVAAHTPTRAEFGLPERGFVFGCFNQAYKITPDTFSLWMNLLRAVPDSVLWLAEANRWAVGNLKRAAVAAGIAAGRIVFAPRKPLSEYLLQYQVADLAVDTFPYTSHTTASDALWMGCPLVTRAGDTFASRVAGSIVSSAGLPELVVETREQYEHLTTDLARSPPRLAQVRDTLREQRDTCILFDSTRRARDLESAYEAMLEAWRRNSTPRPDARGAKAEPTAC